MTCCPHASVSFCASVRDMTSVPPPGGNGTIQRTGLEGYVSAAKPDAEAMIAAMKSIDLRTECFSSSSAHGAFVDQARDFALVVAQRGEHLTGVFARLRNVETGAET